MKSLRLLVIGCLAASPVLVTRDAFAQFGIPKFPKRGKADSRARRGRQGADEQSGAAAQGVPVPPDSPIFDAFRRLEGQSVYHQRMKLTVDDPKMAEIMAQMGFTPPETIVAGDTKQVSLHVSMPVSGKVEDFELRAVSRNGRIAKKWSSPASGRILKEIDANLAKQLADYEAQQSTSIARSLAMGPWGLASAGISAAATAANLAAVPRIRKQAHDFFEWSCMDGGAAPADHREPPPLTDLRQLGDQTLDGIAVAAYEFFVRQNGKLNGPVRMYVAKETGLPARIALTDPRGGMQMDYFGFNQGSEIEIPACLGEHK